MSILLLFWLFLLRLPAIRSMPLPGSLKTHLALFRYSWQWPCHVLVWSSMADCMSSNSFYQAGFTEPSNSCITSPFSGFENLIKTIPYKTWVPCLPLISPLLTSAFSCWINKEVLHCCHPHNSILRTHMQLIIPAKSLIILGDSTSEGTASPALCTWPIFFTLWSTTLAACNHQSKRNQFMRQSWSYCRAGLPVLFYQAIHFPATANLLSSDFAFSSC